MAEKFPRVGSMALMYAVVRCSDESRAPFGPARFQASFCFSLHARSDSYLQSGYVQARQRSMFSGVALRFGRPAFLPPGGRMG